MGPWPRAPVRPGPTDARGHGPIDFDYLLIHYIYIIYTSYRHFIYKMIFFNQKNKKSILNQKINQKNNKKNKKNTKTIKAYKKNNKNMKKNPNM